MNAADIRDLYRDFFVAHGHLAGEPASLVPAGDTSVLFTTAGMQQYKPYFLGVETPPSTRITTCQRSFRTSDVENVGKTARHLTFFEMLGNFSFGDYFKAEAIEWALELSDQLGIDRSKVWVSVYGGDAQVPADEEAVELWKSHGFTDDRIVRLGRSDNFWGPAGPTGPCGPCSELYYDFGPEMGCDDPDCKPGCDCDRYLEYWNLVFVQYDMDESGDLTPLAKGSIDTGMGLERIDRFDLSRGVELTTYATPNIVGEIKRYFRDKGWSVRVPRGLQELNIRLNKVIDELVPKLQRSPTINELAEAANATPEEVLEALETSQAYNSVSLQASPNGESGEEDAGLIDYLGGEEEAYDTMEDRTTLAPGFAKLDKRERYILHLRFFEGLTQSQIAERVGISQMHVSRLIRRSLEKLREEIGDLDNPLPPRASDDER